jgi:hypothetical protein
MSYDFNGNKVPHYGILSYGIGICLVIDRSKLPNDLFLLMEMHSGTGTPFSKIQNEYENKVLFPQGLLKQNGILYDASTYTCRERFIQIIVGATVPLKSGFMVDFVFSFP